MQKVGGVVRGRGEQEVGVEGVGVHLAGAVLGVVPPIAQRRRGPAVHLLADVPRPDPDARDPHLVGEPGLGHPGGEDLLSHR